MDATQRCHSFQSTRISDSGPNQTTLLINFLFIDFFLCLFVWEFTGIQSVSSVATSHFQFLIALQLVALDTVRPLIGPFRDVTSLIGYRLSD